MPEEDERIPALERHAQTVIAVMVVGLLAWVGMTTQATQVKVAELAVEVNHLKNVIRTPEARVNDLTRRIELIEEHVLGDPSRINSEILRGAPIDRR